MDFDDEDEKIAARDPKFPIQMYISEGNQYFRLGKYDLAIELFNKGLEKEPINGKCLIGRSKCYMGLAKFAEAKEDAEQVVKSNPKSCDAKMLIGEADYFLGDFEKAFLTFYRGYRSRTNHDGLRCGHQMCRKAIDNALNPDIPVVIDDEDVGNLLKLKEDLDVDQMISTGQDQYSADVNFINSLLQDDSVELIHEDCEFLKHYLRDRQIFWKTQNPSTSRKDSPDSTIKVSKGKDVGNIYACHFD